MSLVLSLLLSQHFLPDSLTSDRQAQLPTDVRFKNRCLYLLAWLGTEVTVSNGCLQCSRWLRALGFPCAFQNLSHCDVDISAQKVSKLHGGNPDSTQEFNQGFHDLI